LEAQHHALFPDLDSSPGHLGGMPGEPRPLTASVFGIGWMQVGVQQRGVLDESPQEPLAAGSGSGGRRATIVFSGTVLRVLWTERQCHGVRVGEVEQSVPVDLESRANTRSVILPLPKQCLV